MKLKHINTEISHLATMEAKNYISNHGLEQLKEFEYLKSLHEEKVKNLSLSGVSQQRELLSDLIDFSNNNAPPIIQKGLKQVILEFNQSLNCG